MTSEQPGPEVGIWDLIPYAGIFDAAPFADEVDEQLSDYAFATSVLVFESMVTHALGEYGVLPKEPAIELAHDINDVPVDMWQLREGMSDHATPIISLVAKIREHVGPERASLVHVGLTSQDCIDTAHQMMHSRALNIISGHVQVAIEMLTSLASETVDWPMLARTLGQPAAPTTFGWKLCSWVSGLEAAYEQLLDARAGCAVQIGGAVGDQKDLGEQPVRVAAIVAQALELAVPRMPWHTERSRVLTTATAYVQTINACSKIAGDVISLATPGIEEITLGGDPEQAERGGSSAMPHKRNPVGAVQIRSAATQAPGLLASVAAAGVQAHERAAGEWQAEWRPMRDLAHLAGGAVKELRFLLQDLKRIDRDAMKRNLDAAEVGTDASAATARVGEFLARYRESISDEELE